MSSSSSLMVGGKIKYKIVLLGDQHVGKSSLIYRFVSDNFEAQATIGIDFSVRNLVHNDKMYRIQLWDTAGQQKFRAVIPNYLKDSNCALIVYDITDKKTLQSAIKWYQFYQQHKQSHSIQVLVGNKIDLQNNVDCCTNDEIKQIADKLNIMSMKISAKTGQGIHELFIKTIDNISDARLNNKTPSNIKQQNQLLQQSQVGSNNIKKITENIKINHSNHCQVQIVKTQCC